MNAKKLQVCGRCNEVFPRERLEHVRGFLRKRVVTARVCPKCGSLGILRLDWIIEDQATNGALLWP